MSPRIRTGHIGTASKTAVPASSSDFSQLETDRPSGILYVVPTPIGNIQDITLRALDMLAHVDTIAAEDPHITRKLLSHYNIASHLMSYSGKQDELDSVLTGLRAGKQIALVCDVGTPTIADPGAKLIAAAIDDGHRVTGLPGPVAATLALSISGMGSNRFTFDGFPPRRTPDRAVFFASLVDERRTIILYESPRYLRSTLITLCNALGSDRRIALLSALTTKNERIWRGSLEEAVSNTGNYLLHGPFTLVVAGSPLHP